MRQEISKTRGLASNVGEAQNPRQDYNSAYVRQYGQTEKKSNEQGTHKMIVEVAERLFRQIGFQKTTVADIADELHMSPANVYRFFAAKSEINEAVCADLLGKIEVEAQKIAESRSTATERIYNLIGYVESTHHQRYIYDRKLHDLIDAAIIKNWAIMRRHTERMTEILEQIIANGMASGEFPAGDAKIAACLVSTACLRFRDPRLIVEHEQEAEPTLDQMIGFCLTALTAQASS